MFRASNVTWREAGGGAGVELRWRVEEAEGGERSRILLRLKVGQAGVVRRLAQVPWKLVESDGGQINMGSSYVGKEH